MRIPFDSLTLAAVVGELRRLVGCRVQQASQPDDTTLVLGLYGPGGESWLLLSWHAEIARVHLSFRKPRNAPIPSGLLQAVRAHVVGGRLESVEQQGFDRVVRLSFRGPKGRRDLVLEAMGKHSNLALLDDGGRILSCGKVVGRSKSRRPVLPGHPYAPPPFAARPSLLDATDPSGLEDREGASPFLLKWIRAHPGGFDAAMTDVRAAAGGAAGAYLSPGHGAYPLNPAALGLEAFERPSISVALDQHYSAHLVRVSFEQARSSLEGQLRRVLAARLRALEGVRQGLEEAAEADSVTRQAELILAFGPSTEPGSRSVPAFDAEGRPVELTIDAEAGWLGTAERLFAKAKRLKAAARELAIRMGRLTEEIGDLEAYLAKLGSASQLREVEEVREVAAARRWLSQQRSSKGGEAERAFDGHRIREVSGPAGVVALVGLNAEANDYLTTRVAKPNDLWLHVRGAVSAHVVIPTGNRPERITREQLEWAARLAVENSPSKHSGFVPVDYTLKKHVRKPRGSSPGAVFYTHEKTIHVEREKGASAT